MIWFWFRWVIRLGLRVVGFGFVYWLRFWVWVMNLFKFERVKDGLNINGGEVFASKGLIKEIVILHQLVLFHHIFTVFLVRLMMRVMFLFSRLRFRVIMRLWSRLRFRIIMRLWLRVVRLRLWVMIRLGMVRLRLWMVIRLRMVGLWMVIGFWVVGLWVVWLWMVWFHLCWEGWPVEILGKITEWIPGTVCSILSLNFWSMKIVVNLIFDFW